MRRLLSNVACILWEWAPAIMVCAAIALLVAAMAGVFEPNVTTDKHCPSCHCYD